MKKLTKTLLVLMLIGIGGVTVMMAFIMGSGTLMSREAQNDYAVEQDFSDVKMDTVMAQVTVEPSEQTHVTAYAKAWLSAPIDMDAIVDVSVKDGVLRVKESPFPDEFFGIFPQPYELKLTLYLPQEIYDAVSDDL